jgi:predicted HTH transcriptional regulator
VEFKYNNDDPERIGEYVSALSNSAALLGQEAAYLVWGVDDASRQPVGTSARPLDRRVGNEELENWLSHNTTPRIHARFVEWELGGQPMVLLRIEPAWGMPVAFKGTEWIRIGSVKAKLKAHPGREKDLWAVLSGRCFEQGVAEIAVSGDQVLASFDYPKYFELSETSLPANRTGIFERLVQDRLIVVGGNDTFSITNLGAILFARELAHFPTLSRKAMRIVKYRGLSRTETEHEKLIQTGYASSFEAIAEYINDLCPSNEVLERALRRDVRMYPGRAIRELVANALIHQDFSISGTGPMVEVFDDRLEISNPGLPLIEPLRFIDHSPRSRNEILADLMRRLGICEERGSGFDKVVTAVELYQLPAPDVRTDSTHTRVVLFAHKALGDMDKGDRMRACYQHSCLLYVSNRVMTNSTLRERFGLEESGYPTASRIIRETIAGGLVKPEDPANQSRKHARYVPFWA